MVRQKQTDKKRYLNVTLTEKFFSENGIRQKYVNSCKKIFKKAGTQNMEKMKCNFNFNFM